jgi:hypothetical protein
VARRRKIQSGPLGLIEDIDNPPLSLAGPLIEMAEEYLRVPGGVRAGDPLVLSDEQFELLWAWYAVTPDGRRFVHNRKLMVRMSKGWAKSPLGAVDAFNNLVGDVVPDGLDAHGRPVGRPHPAPWYQIAATALDQSDNLFMQLYAMLRESPAIDDLKLDVGLTRIRCWGKLGEGIVPVTSEGATREGQPITGAAKEETQLWFPSNGGVKLSNYIDDNRTKSAGGFARVLELYNAFVPGTGSVAERNEAKLGKGRGSGILHIAREATVPAEDMEQMRKPKFVRDQLAHAYGSAAIERGGWIDLDGVTQEIVEANDDEMPAKIRKFFNVPWADTEDGLDGKRWAELVKPGAQLAKGNVIALGFDGSDVGDATALYACRWPDWCVFKVKVWERPLDENGMPIKGAWKVPRSEVMAEVRAACRLYKVVRGYFDDSGWQSEIDELTAEFGQSVMRFPHRQDNRIGPAAERWTTMIVEKTLCHDGDETLPRHAANARKVTIGKVGLSKWWRPARKLDSLPIDALSAAISAVHALGDAVAHGEVAETPAPATARSVPDQPGSTPNVFRPSDRLRL